MRYLVDVSAGTPVFKKGHLTSVVRSLRLGLEWSEMHVTRRIVQPICDMVDELEKEATAAESGADDKPEDPNYRENRYLTDDEANRIKEHATILQATIFAESAGKVAYIATDRRYTIKALTEDIGSIFGEGVFDKIPDIAKYDFEQAGLALAYDLPTAAAFHLMRGAEACLRYFYERIQRQNRIKEPRLWKAMTDHLAKRSSPPPKVLLDALDNVRANFRNPTQHPEKVYDMDEAQDLMALSADVTSRMIRYLEVEGKLVT